MADIKVQGKINCISIVGRCKVGHILFKLYFMHARGTGPYIAAHTNQIGFNQVLKPPEKQNIYAKVWFYMSMADSCPSKNLKPLRSLCSLIWFSALILLFYRRWYYWTNIPSHMLQMAKWLSHKIPDNQE